MLAFRLVIRPILALSTINVSLNSSTIRYVYNCNLSHKFLLDFSDHLQVAADCLNGIETLHQCHTSRGLPQTDRQDLPRRYLTTWNSNRSNTYIINPHTRSCTITKEYTRTQRWRENGVGKKEKRKISQGFIKNHYQVVDLTCWSSTRYHPRINFVLYFPKPYRKRFCQWKTKGTWRTTSWPLIIQETSHRAINWTPLKMASPIFIDSSQDLPSSLMLLDSPSITDPKRRTPQPATLWPEDVRNDYPIELFNTFIFPADDEKIEGLTPQ